jgi:hydrogenase/urease accessory protein HupE
MSQRDYPPPWRGVLAAGGALLLWPWRAEAHLVTTGLGPVYDGIGHLLVTPEDLLPVLALALCAGLGGAGLGRCVLCVLPSAWLAGGCVGLLVHGLPAFPILALSLLILGTLVATDLRLPPTVVTALAVGLGLVHGCLNGVAMRQAGAGALGLLGIMAALFVLVALVAVCVVRGRAPAAVDADRRAGSRELDRRHGPVAAGVGPAWRELKKRTGFGYQGT